MHHVSPHGWYRAAEGFTLIELVIVIVLIGILSAVALPRFASLSQEARINKVESLASGFKSAVNRIQAQWILAGSPTSTGAFVDFDLGEGRNIPLTPTGGLPINSEQSAAEFWDAIMMQSLPSNMQTQNSYPLFELYFDSTTCGFAYDQQDASVTTDTSGC